MRKSSFQQVDVAISREVESQYDVVKVVGDNIELLEDLAEAITAGVFTNAGLVVAEPLRSAIIAVGDIAADVTTVAAIDDEVAAVAAIDSEVIAVYGKLAEIVAVYGALDKLVELHGVLSKLTTLADSLPTLAPLIADLNDVVVVAAHITDVNSVSDNMANVVAVNANESNINSVSSGIAHVREVSTHMGTVTYVAGMLDEMEGLLVSVPNINLVANDIANVDVVAVGIDNISAVATNMAAVTTVATNAANVNTVATNMVGVQEVVTTVVPNMAEILLADTNAATATTKAAEALASKNAAGVSQVAAGVSQVAAAASELAADVSATEALASEYKAQAWAENAEDDPVQGTIGIDDEYSAYHWAKKAEAAASGNVTADSLYDVAVTTPADGQVLMYDADGVVTAKWVNTTLTKNSVGLSNVNNTADVDKAVLSATKLATARTINGVSFDGTANITIIDSTKAPIASPTFTGTVSGITKAMVGLGAVDNTTDAGKPVSTATQTALNLKVNTSALGLASGVATLGSDGKVPTAQLPSYVDDVLEYVSLTSFPAVGEAGKIYVDLATNKTYRWSGTVYIYITSGAVDSVAGKTGIVTLTKADVGLTNADNTADVNKNVLSATKLATTRAIQLSGDVTGTVDFDGSAAVNMTTAVGDNTHSHGDSTITDVAWSKISSKPDPVVTVTLTGDVTGTANATLTDLGNGTVTVATTIAANSVALGTDTTGNYVVGVSAGSGIVVTGTAAEGWIPTIAHADTSTAASVVSNNVDGIVVQDVTLTFDTYGHATAASVRVVNLDDRYYTETETQTALNLKANLASPTFTGTVVLPSTTSIGTITSTELGYVDGVTSSIQTQLNSKANLASPTFTGTVNGVTKTMVGLGDVDNTSDATKNVLYSTTAGAVTGQGALATLSSVNASTITDNSVGAAELNVTGNGTTSQYLRSDGDGTFTWATPADTNTTYTAGTGLSLTGTVFANTSPNVSTNLTYTTATTTGSVNSSDGTNATIPAATTSLAGLMTNADKTKLDGITAGANNYVHPSADGSLHVPATSTTNNGKVLTAGATAGSLSWTTIPAGVTDHTLLSNIGTNTHAQIDTALTRLANTSGTNTGDQTTITGNAGSATVLQTARTIAISGDATGTATSFNGSANISIPVTLGTVPVSKGGTGVTTSTGTGSVVLSASPTLTGTVVLPSTTSIGTVSSTEIGYLAGVTSAVQTQLNAKAPTTSPTFTGTVSGVTKAMVGLDLVDNTTDTGKPVSTATQTALNLKANLASPTFTGTVSGITAAMVGLGSVNNTADSAKSVAYADRANKFDSVSHPGVYWLTNTWDGSYWNITANHGSPVRVGIADNSTKWNGSTQYTSTAAASGGVDGDIWFQY